MVITNDSPIKIKYLRYQRAQLPRPSEGAYTGGTFISVKGMRKSHFFLVSGRKALTLHELILRRKRVKQLRGQLSFEVRHGTSWPRE